MKNKMKLRLVNGMEKALGDVSVLAVITCSNYIDNKYCGLNVKINFVDQDHTKADKYIQAKISHGEIVDGYLIGSLKNCTFKVCIPISIHGGNVGESYFGFINPTIFENVK